MPDSTSWPWLTGQWQMAKLMATRHHEALADPQVSALKQFHGLTWLQIFHVGELALKRVGTEIASAQTVEEVESARLRKQEYEAAFGAAVGAMLKVAERQASDGLLIGYGRQSPREPAQVIPPSYWPFSQFDWGSRSLKSDGWLYRDVRFIRVPTAPEDVRAAIEADLIKARVDPLPVWCQGISGSTDASAGAAGPGRFSQARLESWYKRWVDECSKNGVRPSVEDDWNAAKAKLGAAVTRDAVRKARATYAPKEWKARGRPRKQAEK